MVSPSSALLLVYTVVAAVGPLIVVPARADLVDSNHSSLVGCDNPPPVKAGHGYRDGRCGGCECCPMRWSCLEMHSRGYSCPERIGVPVEDLAMSLTPATWTVGDVIEASVSGLRWRSLPRCHSVLPPGLQLELNTTDDSTSEPALLFLRGVLGYDPSRPDTYSWDLEIDGVVGNSNTEQYDVQRVRGTVVTIINAVHKRVQWIQAQEDLLVSNDAKARAAGVAGFRAFEQYYNEHTLSHEHAVRRMYSSEQELVSVLDETPAVSAGIFWNWAGGLYMNLHKLLEDVLVSGCEHHFEQGLLYSPDDEILRSNLDGCFAKRLLESAKFMWLAALQLLANTEASTEDLTECRQLLKAATTVKEGWGWGVNNGDIHLSLASVRILWSLARGCFSRGSADTNYRSMSTPYASGQSAPVGRQSCHRRGAVSSSCARRFRLNAKRVAFGGGTGDSAVQISQRKQRTCRWLVA